MEHIVTQSRCISINFPRVYLFALAAYSRASMLHYDLRGDPPGVWGKWQRGLLNLINLGRILVEDTSGLPIFMEFRCILFWDTSESDVLGTSRCIWNVWFLEHTSEMPNLGACPMYYDTGLSRRYIGIEISMSIPMYGSPNLSTKYIGMDQYRLFPMYRQISPFGNTSESGNS